MSAAKSYPVLRRVFVIFVAPVFAVGIIGDAFGRALLEGAKQSVVGIQDIMEEMRAIWRGDRDAD